MRRVAPVLMAFVAMALPATAQTETSVETKVTFNFKGTSFDLVIEAIRDHKVNIAVDPSFKTDRLAVTASVSKAPLSKLLDAIQEEHKLKRTVWCNAIYLYPADKAAPKTPAPPKGKGAFALKKRMNAKYARTPLATIVTKLKARTKLSFYIPARVRRFLRNRDRRVTLRLWRTTVHHVLDHATRASGVTWSFKDGRVSFAATGPVSSDDPGDVGLKHFDAKKAKATLKGALPAVQIRKLVKWLGDTRTRLSAVRELISSGKQVLPEVAKALRKWADAENPDEPSMNAALKVIERIGHPSEYQVVLKVFKDEDQSISVRRNAGRALGAIRAPEAVNDLIAALDNRWFRISETARHALVQIGAPSVKPLRKVYEEWSVKEKGRDGLVYRALLVFGEIGNAEAKQVLLKAINTRRSARSLPIRHHAAIGLGYTGDPNMIKPLIRALQKAQDDRAFLIAKYITRSLTWITDEEIEPDAIRWRSWWDTKGKRKFADRTTSDDIVKRAGGLLNPEKDKKKFIKIKTLKQEIAENLKNLGTKGPSKKKDFKAWKAAREVRKAAAVNLRAIGKKALPALKAAAEDKTNKTLRAWAKYVIKKIERDEIENKQEE